MRVRRTPVRGLHLQLVAAVCIVLAVIWVAIAYQVRYAREDALDSARQHGANVARVVAEHFSLFAGTVDTHLKRLRVQWKEDAARLGDTTADGELLGGDRFSQVLVADARGRVIYRHSAAASDRRLVEDQDYFRAPRDSGAERLYIGKPVAFAADGRIGIPFSRPLRDARGKFSGVLVLRIAADDLIDTYKTINLGESGFITLRDVDGNVLIRTRGYAEALHRPRPNWRGVVGDHQVSGSFIRPATFDGRERVFSFHRIADYPLIVAVGQSLEEVLVRYYAQRRAYVIGGVLVSVMLLLLLVVALLKAQRDARADVELRESETRYRMLSETSADVYWETDADYRFTLVKRSASSGGPTEHRDWLGKRVWELRSVLTPKEEWDPHRAALDRRESFRDFVVKAVNFDGSLVYMSVSGYPVFGPDGVYRGYRGVAHDVTRTRHGEQMAALEHRVVRCLAEAETESECMRAVMQAICETQGWECARYFAVDEEAGELRLADAWTVPDPIFDAPIERSRDLRMRPGEGIPGIAWESSEPVWVADLEVDARAPRRSFTSQVGIRGAFAFPVVSDGGTAGVLIFNSREVRKPDERVLAATRMIGSEIGQFLRRKRSERELRASEERFRSLTELSSDSYWEQDAEHRFTTYSHTAREWLGRGWAPDLGKRRWDLPCLNMTEDDWAAHIAQLDARQPFRDLELCRVNEAGEKMWMSVSGEPVFDEQGRFKGYRGVARNISQRKNDEESLRRFRTAMDLSGDMILLIDRETMRFVDFNERARTALGYAREELFSMGPHDILPRSRAEFERAYDELIANGTSNTGMRSQYRCRDGSFLPFEATRRALRSGDRWIIVAIARDVRDQIAAEQALHRSNERFDLAVRATNDVIRDWDLISDQLWCNDNITRAFGYAIDRIDHTGSFWRVNIHPDDFERVVDGVGRMIDSRDSQWTDEYRFRRKDGSYAHVLDRCHVVRNEAGKALRVIGAMTDITVRKEAEERLTYLAQFDNLTGLPNRHLFRDRLNQSMARASRSGRPIAVLFVDLDRFKLVNDTLGHAAGDLLLTEAAQRLQSCVRPGDTVGRFGGDEFGIILADLAESAHATIVTQKIIDAIARPFILDGHETYVTASIGITLYPADGEEAGTLIMNADNAMYRAKEQGRNGYQFFTREMNERAMQRVKIESAMRRAVERREFLLHYQPKVQLRDGTVCGFEALLRWQDPERGLVSPMEFIPVLEDTGLIVPVGEWVLEEVCAQIRRWQKVGLDVPPVAVNLSARQFQHQGLEESVRRILNDAGVPPSLVELELTESLLMKDPEAAERTLQGLKASNVKLSVDDFGTGYSSLSYLKRFPLDTLKVDRAFIRDVTINPDDAAITQAIIGLAHSLKLGVIAEGVETQQQLDFLRLHGCDEIQGYLFSKPVVADECARMLREGVRLEVEQGADVPALKTRARRMAVQK